MALDLTNVNNLMDNILGMLKVPKVKSPSIPSRLVLGSRSRSGISAKEVGANIIRRRGEVGLPVGVMPNGDINPDEMMEIIRVEEIFDAINTNAKTTVAINPGIQVVGTGQTASGQPCVFNGRTVSIGTGYAIIE